MGVSLDNLLELAPVIRLREGLSRSGVGGVLRGNRRAV